MTKIITKADGYTDAQLEDLADELHEAGYKVRVNRYGNGVGRHTGLPGCGVESIEIVGAWK